MVAADRVPGWLFMPERNFAQPAADEGESEGDETPVPRERLALVFDVAAAATYRRPHPSGLVGWVAVDAMNVGLRQSLAELYPCLRLIGLAAAITVHAGWTYQVSEILASIVGIRIWGF